MAYAGEKRTAVHPGGTGNGSSAGSDGTIRQLYTVGLALHSALEWADGAAAEHIWVAINRLDVVINELLSSSLTDSHGSGAASR